MSQTYLDKCLPYLYDKGEITAFDVQRITNTTATHKILQILRVRGYIDSGEWKKSNGKKFKVHKLLKKQLELI